MTFKIVRGLTPLIYTKMTNQNLVFKATNIAVRFWFCVIALQLIIRTQSCVKYVKPVVRVYFTHASTVDIIFCNFKWFSSNNE